MGNTFVCAMMNGACPLASGEPWRTGPGLPGKLKTKPPRRLNEEKKRKNKKEIPHKRDVYQTGPPAVFIPPRAGRAAAIHLSVVDMSHA